MRSSGPREQTVRKLFALSMNQCAFPDCTTPIVDERTGTILGEVCHIHAQSQGGPRYDAAQNQEERNASDNLVLMCRNHHKVIDASENLIEFTAERLRAIKLAHERLAIDRDATARDLSAAALAALILSGTTYESGSTHMDFRHAEFRVGGEGGAFGGGGGGGGVLTIVGISQLPEDISISLDGQPGRAPGGGGGGGGAVQFVGRGANSEDRRNGLSVSSLFTVDAVSLNGSLNVLGAGWSFCPIPDVPYSVTLTFAYIVECGKVAPGTFMRFDLGIHDPWENIVASAGLDIKIPEQELLVRRVPCFQRIQFSVSSFGLWYAKLSSGDSEFARIQFEFLQG